MPCNVMNVICVECGDEYVITDVFVALNLNLHLTDNGDVMCDSCYAKLQKLESDR